MVWVVGVGLGMGDIVGLALGIGVGVPVGVPVPVAVGLGVALGAVGGCAQYIPPVSQMTSLMRYSPPQTIISLPVQTAVCEARREGAVSVFVAVQVSVTGLYLLPVLK